MMKEINEDGSDDRLMASAVYRLTRATASSGNDDDGNEDDSSHVGSMGGTGDEQPVVSQVLSAHQDELAILSGNKQDKAVKCLRVAVFAVLVLVATFVSVACWYSLQQDQETDFDHDFSAYATIVLDAFAKTFGRKLEAADSLAVGITSFAMASQLAWPNVSIPDFEIRGAGARVLSESSLINFFPVVTDEARRGWEAFMVENRDATFDSSLMSDFYQRAVQDAFFNHTAPSFGDTGTGGRKLYRDLQGQEEEEDGDADPAPLPTQIYSWGYPDGAPEGSGK